MSRRILITGATGCVGSYLVDALLDEGANDLVLPVRNPNGLSARARSSGRVLVHPIDVRALPDQLASLGPVDDAVLIAAAWGGPAAFEVNFNATRALLERLDAQGVSRAIYFSTASVIDQNKDLRSVARDLGTEYIQSKYQLVASIDDRSWNSEIIGLFPTLVLGGGGDRPLSHLSKLLIEAAPWARLAGHATADGRFHLIHARDIARVVVKLLSLPPKSAVPEPMRHVLGMPATETEQIIEMFARYFGARRWPRFALKSWHAEALIKLFRIQLSPWDRYCMLNRDQSYLEILNPQHFGEAPYAKDLTAALTELTSLGLLRR